MPIDIPGNESNMGTHWEWKMHPSKVPFGENVMLVSWRLPIPVNCESETLILDHSPVKITWDSWILVTLK